MMRIRHLALTLAALGSAMLLAAPTGAQGLSAAAQRALIDTGAESGAVTLAMAQTYRGPGPVTVGYLGTKKQLLVPNGDWVVVGLRDFKSTHARPVSMAQVALAQLEQGRVRALLLARFDSKPQGSSAKPTWGDVSRCDEDTTPTLQKWSQDLGPVHQCVRLRRGRIVDTFWRGDWHEQLRRHLDVADLRPADDRFIRTDLYMSDYQYGGALLITRLDFDASAFTDAAKSEARAVWARAYAGYALQGYRRSLEADELQPVTPQGTPPSLVLPN